MNPNDEDGGESSVQVQEQRTGDGESRTRQPKVEDLRREHLENRAGIEQVLRTLPRSDDYDAAKPTLQADGKSLEATGVALNHIPDFLRPTYIKIVNLISKPDERLNKKREQVQDVVSNLDGITKELTAVLFGPGYKGVEGKVGGLHKKYLDAGDARYKCAKAIVSLDEEINKTYSRIKSTESALSDLVVDSVQNNKIPELHEILAGYKFDLDRYEDIKGDLEGNLEAYDKEIQCTAINIKATRELRDYARDAVNMTTGDLKRSKIDTSHREYTRSITALMPELRKKLTGYGEMLKVFQEEQRRQLDDVVTTTEQTLQPLLTDGVSHDPFKYHQGKKEKDSERISARAQEILKNPFGDMYKV